ncbi:hypothetical protein AQF98_15970 [Pedobacter sp. Hv1]|nr:hypothetical protein AQF98_15970 [Pedobacter sp. Hv1]
MPNFNNGYHLFLTIKSLNKCYNIILRLKQALKKRVFLPYLSYPDHVNFINELVLSDLKIIILIISLL